MKESEVSLPTGAENVTWNLDDLVAPPVEGGLSAFQMKELLTEYEALVEAVGRVESSAYLSWTTQSDDPARRASAEGLRAAVADFAEGRVPRHRVGQCPRRCSDQAHRHSPALPLAAHGLESPGWCAWPPRDGCCRCGSPMKVLAVITDPQQCRRILLHLIKTGVAPPDVEASFTN